MRRTFQGPARRHAVRLRAASGGALAAAAVCAACLAERPAFADSTPALADESAPREPRPPSPWRADVKGPGDDAAVPSDLDRLILEVPKSRVKPLEAHVLRVQIHGEYELRYEHLSTLPLDASPAVMNAKPGTFSDPLGQHDFVSHWLRVTPRFQVSDILELVGQMDVLTGLIAGNVAHDTSADQTPRDTFNGLTNVQPRWLYVDYHSKVGLLRVGQQPSHWAMGIVANDGDHYPLFGDYRYGDIVERVLFATKPAGERRPFTLAAAGDLVYRDEYATLTQGDHAFEGVLAAIVGDDVDQVGLYGVYRNQTHSEYSDGTLYPYDDKIDVGVIDLAGKFAAPVPNSKAFVFGQGEIATILGSSNAERTAAEAAAGTFTKVREFGGAVQLGVVHLGREAPRPKGPAPMDYGDVVAQVEVGYASGDSNPYDGTEHRFTFNPNHKVGLVLFDEVMRFQTARAATVAQSALLANGTRPAPGANLLPSNGGVFGAQYVNPTVVVRPRRWVDLKAGVVVAQATADVVDPYRLATQGAYVNYQGGDPRRRDLGVELDGGVEMRFRLDYGLVAMVGVEAGVLFPGGALANAQGEPMNTQWVGVGRAGLSF